MSYSFKGVGSYYLSGFGSAEAQSAPSYTADCDIAEQFDPDLVAKLWNQQFHNNDNGAGKAATYYTVGALWRLGYTATGFEMTKLPVGYVSWANTQGAMWNAWRKQALGAASPNGIWPSVGSNADITAFRKMKEQLLAVQAGTKAPPGPYDPKVVCVSGTGGGATVNVPEVCPAGTTGTPPNCKQMVAPPSACAPAQTPSFQGAQFSDADWQLRLALYNRATKKLGNYGADGSKVVTGTWGPADDQAMAAFVAAEGLSSQADASGNVDPQIRYARLAEKTPGACDAATVEATVKAINGTAKPVVSGKCPTGYKLVGTKCVKIVVTPPNKPSYAGFMLGAAALVGLGALVWINRDKAKAGASKVAAVARPKLAAAKARVRRAGSAAKGKILAVVPKGMRLRQVSMTPNRRRRRRRAR